MRIREGLLSRLPNVSACAPRAQTSQHVPRVIVSSALVIGAWLLVGCERMIPGGCGERNISDDRIVQRAVDRIVRESRATDQPDSVQYSSVEEFFAANPNCCFIHRPGDYRGQDLQLPFGDDLEVAIRYRRYLDRERAFDIQWVTFDRCLVNYEHSGQSLTEDEYKASLRWRLGWRVR